MIFFEKTLLHLLKFKSDVLRFLQRNRKHRERKICAHSLVKKEKVKFFNHVTFVSGLERFEPQRER